MHSITVVCLLFAFANVKADLSLGHRHEGPGPNDQYNGETPFGESGGHQHNPNCYTPNGEINHQEHYEHHHHVGGAEDSFGGGSSSGGGNQGYEYQQPNFQAYNQQSSGQFQQPAGHINAGHSESFASGPSFNAASNENQFSDRFGTNAFGSSSSSTSGLSAGFGHGSAASGVVSTLLGGGGGNGQLGGGGNGHFGGGGGGGGDGAFNDEYSQHDELPPIVTKNFYFHAAPEEREINLGTKYVNLGRSHKAYNVIFIRAPTYTGSANIVPVLPKNQQKTIVYLLSKKPEFNTHVADVKEEAYKPVKPDIFFLKYKTAADAEHAQHQIQAAYDEQNFGVNSDTGIDPQSLRLGIQEDFAENNEGSISGGIGGASSGNGGVSVGINDGGIDGGLSQEQEEHHHHSQSNHHHHPPAAEQQFSNNGFASSSNQQNDNAVDVNFISTSQNHQHTGGAESSGSGGGGAAAAAGGGGCCGGSSGSDDESVQNQPPPCCGK